MPQDTHIEITFAPEKLSLDSLETLADDLGLHIVSIVDNVLS